MKIRAVIIFSHLKVVFYGSLGLYYVLPPLRVRVDLGIVCVAMVSALYVALPLLPGMFFRQGGGGHCGKPNLGRGSLHFHARFERHQERPRNSGPSS